MTPDNTTTTARHSDSRRPARRTEHFVADVSETPLQVTDRVKDEAAPLSLWGEAWKNPDMAVVGNVARYHRRASPQKSHLPYMALDRETRVEVNKMGALLRLANALDADHLQKVKDVRVLREETDWILEVDGAGDMTMERLAATARSDFMTEVFGRRLAFREAAVRAWA